MMLSGFRETHDVSLSSQPSIFSIAGMMECMTAAEKSARLILNFTRASLLFL